MKRKEIQQLAKQADDLHEENKELLQQIKSGCFIIDATKCSTESELKAAIDTQISNGYTLQTSLNSLLIFVK
jgi:cell division septum initiation protein DivIVA